MGKIMLDAEVPYCNKVTCVRHVFTILPGNNLVMSIYSSLTFLYKGTF